MIESRRDVFPDAREFRRLWRPGSIVRVLRTERWVLPTERAGSEGVMYAACRQRPLWWLRHHLARWEACHWILRHRAGYLSEGAFMGRLGANVSGLAYSYAEYAPCSSLRIQFPCHPLEGALWVLGSGVNLGLWQQRRENHTTSLRSWKCTPIPASRDFHLKVKRLTTFCASLTLLQNVFAVHPGGGSFSGAMP